MITLLGSLLGFFSAAFPELLKLWRDRADRAHELAILDRQMEMQKAGAQQRLEEIRIGADALEAQALYQTYHTHIPWVDALNGTVRPVLAYAFFFLYASVKWAALLAMLSMSAMTLSGAWVQLWQEEDQAIFAGIISFYFGSRAMRRMGK